MIIWISGPYGVGKSTLAEALAAKMENSLIFDAEAVGNAVRGSYPDCPYGCIFEDYPLWGEFCWRLLKDVHEKFHRDILVPMTLLRRESYGILEKLRADGIETHLVILEAGYQTVHDRILARGEKEGCWCMENIELARAGSAALPGLHLQTDNKTAEKLAQTLMSSHGIPGIPKNPRPVLREMIGGNKKMMKLGFGVMRLPVFDGDQTKIDLERFQEMADAFLAAGGSYFDTAYPYHGGYSERALREAVVKRYPRDRFTITDKMPISMVEREAQLEEIFSEQLERCGVDYFDYYWLHALSDRNYDKVQKFRAFEFIQKKQAQGKVRHIGFSFHDSAQMLDRILTDHPEAEYVQLQINYLDWEDPGVQGRACYEVATRHGKPVIVMEPVKGGALATLPESAKAILTRKDPDSSMASWAVRYAASPENVMMVLSGMSTLEQVRDNLGYMKDFRPLDEGERAALDQAVTAIRTGIAIPCTGCRYCVTENQCPQNIAIPDYFELYNDIRRFKASGAGARYQDLAGTHGKASDCIGCGKCEKHCPQHLPIREHLKEVAAACER